MDKVARLASRERSDIFRETAGRLKTTNAIVEKDFWVVWILGRIFSNNMLGPNLIFKGGTSLSKIWGLIKRFSEDIDLILNWDLLIEEDPYAERTKTQQSKFNMSLNEKAQDYIRDELLSIMSETLQPYCECEIKEDDRLTVLVKYPALFSDLALIPHIQLEIGPLAMWIPSGEFVISSYAAQVFPDLFGNGSCKVKAILAERTFWEKATILHQEAHRGKGKLMPSRYSRHYYDIAMMASSEVKVQALNNLELLNSVVDFKQRFYSCSWANYEQAVPGTFKIIPPEYRLKELKNDYIAMQNMLFGERVEFEVLISVLEELEDEINNVEDMK